VRTAPQRRRGGGWGGDQFSFRDYRRRQQKLMSPVTAINGVPAHRFRAGIGCGGGRIDAHFTDAACGCMTCGSSPPRRGRAAGHGPRAHRISDSAVNRSEDHQEMDEKNVGRDFA